MIYKDHQELPSFETLFSGIIDSVGLADLLFPKSCLGCDRGGVYVCRTCLDVLSQVEQRCVVCRKPSFQGLTHPSCQDQKTLDGLFIGFAYQGVVRKAIVSLKYKFAEEIASELADHLARRLKEVSPEFLKEAVFILIPLHRKRQNWRGFNQVEAIGKKLANELNLGYEPGLLTRVKQGSPQTTLSAKERKKNIRGVFAVNPDKLILFKTKTLVIFDDVWTTGSTMKESAKELKIKGAKKVFGIVFSG